MIKWMKYENIENIMKRFMGRVQKEFLLWGIEISKNKDVKTNRKNNKRDVRLRNKNGIKDRISFKK